MTHFDAPQPLLPEILALHGKWRANEEAVVCENHRLSWREFIDANHRLAHGLIQQGLKPGDAIGVLMSNGIPMLQTLMGAMAAGVCTVPINLSVNDEAVISMLTDAKVSALALTSDQIGRVEAMQSRLPSSLILTLVDEPEQSAGPLNCLGIDELCAGQVSSLPNIDLQDSTPLNVIYSSGTTGLPKGIMHNHKGRRDWAYDLAIALRYNSSSRTLLTLGLYSNISWVAMLTTLLAGGTLIIHKQFDGSDCLRTIVDEAITHTAMVPIQFQRVIELLESGAEKFDLTSMQAMMSCGSPLHANLKKQIFDYFPCGIIELYGLTEGVITTLEPEQAAGRWSSVGKPLIGTDILILSDDDQVLPAGESGELASRGRITMPGYLHREQANRDATYTDAQGKRWLRTGDIGYADADGFLYIVDRKKDMILSGGQNIYPQDIEAILVAHPDVIDTAVFAATSKKWGETPIAVIEHNANSVFDVAGVKEWANQQLGKQQRLTDIIVIDEIPRNANGKILKRELRQKFSDKVYD